MYSTLTTLQRKRYLFVCINRRAEENPKGCCAAKDSEEVYRALKGEVAARGLAKLEARVCTSSCLDQCATGVTVLVEPDHFFYARVTVADVPEIVDGLVKGHPVKRLVITADQHNGADGISDIEGKTAREAVSKCEQRANFNWASAAWRSSSFLRSENR
jgi:(2Fe-2S) ferredoxin